MKRKSADQIKNGGPLGEGGAGTSGTFPGANGGGPSATSRCPAGAGSAGPGCKSAVGVVDAKVQCSMHAIPVPSGSGREPVSGSAASCVMHRTWSADCRTFAWAADAIAPRSPDRTSA